MQVDIRLSQDDVRQIAEATTKLILAAIAAGEIAGTPPAALPALINEKQAAAMLNVALSTIRYHARMGSLTKHKIGKSTRYDPDEVRALAKQKKTTTGRL
ncbi:MAG: helix-turn-helix domain-containing protein [Saprospiraceae bacterium]|nr:helix-turn-helix domain-containing protein [Saprospiraceae bacterium]